MIMVIVKKTGPDLSQAQITPKYGPHKVFAPQNMGLYECRSSFLTIPMIIINRSGLEAEKKLAELLKALDTNYESNKVAQYFPFNFI